MHLLLQGIIRGYVVLRVRDDIFFILLSPICRSSVFKV